MRPSKVSILKRGAMRYLQSDLLKTDVYLQNKHAPLHQVHGF